MSLGDTGDDRQLPDGGLRQAICTSVGAGITYVVAAGNSSVDTSTFIPAAFPEVIAVSAMTDLDGEPGGAGRLPVLLELFANVCDDTLAFFSNYGAAHRRDRARRRRSTRPGRAAATDESGTSMASPHVAGVAALIKAANKSLTPAQVKNLLKLSGENPNGTTVDPLAAPTLPPAHGRATPTAWANHWSTRCGLRRWPCGRAYRPAAGQPHLPRQRRVGLRHRHADRHRDRFGRRQLGPIPGRRVAAGDRTSAPYTADWDTTLAIDGQHTLTARRTDSTGAYRLRQARPPRSGTNNQGNWVGNSVSTATRWAGGTARPTIWSPCPMPR